LLCDIREHGAIIARTKRGLFWSNEMALDLSKISAVCEKAALLGASRLAGLVTPSGQFVYSYNWRTKTQGKSYNLVRHAGSVWSIFLVASALPHASRLRSDLITKGVLALEWLWSQHGEYIHEGYAIISDDGVNLGGNALALLALTEFFASDPYKRPVTHAEETAPDQTKLSGERREELFKIGHGLAAWMKARAHRTAGQPTDFHHKLSRSGEVENFQSDYYTGEALFSLFRWSELLYRLDPADSVTKSLFSEAEDILKGLAAVNYGVQFQSHWMMHAIGAWRTHPFNRKDGKAVVDLTIESYARALAADVIRRSDYRNRRQSTPIACRSEGLLALLISGAATSDQTAWESEPFNQQMLLTVCENVLLQLKWLKNDGAVINGDSSNRVRIDYIQHNITAWWNFSAFIELADREFKPPERTSITSPLSSPACSGAAAPEHTR
jgi:hypothetical protein